MVKRSGIKRNIASRDLFINLNGSPSNSFQDISLKNNVNLLVALEGKLEIYQQTNATSRATSVYNGCNNPESFLLW